MCNAIYIIAYHGSRDNVETRKKRSDNHNAQIDWWLNYDKQIEIRILAMDFDESEFWDNDRVHYIDRLSNPTPPASARNILFNHFYDTGDDWAIFADSDFMVQLQGTILVSVFAFAFAYILFSIIKAIMGVRVSEEEEERGLDIAEHGQEAYGS